MYAVVCDFLMDKKSEKRANGKPCVELGKSGEMLSMFQKDYSDETLSHTQRAGGTDDS